MTHTISRSSKSPIFQVKGRSLNLGRYLHSTMGILSSFPYFPTIIFISFSLVLVLLYFLGLLYRKTLIECLLMLWPLCLHLAFSVALTLLTHYKVYKISVRLQRKASHIHLYRILVGVVLFIQISNTVNDFISSSAFKQILGYSKACFDLGLLKICKWISL